MRPGKVRWIVSALSLALGLLVATTSANAFQTVRGGQRGVVRGQVLDAAGAPLAGVRILLDGTNVSATTGQDGTYELRNVQDAQITVRAILIGYSSQRTTLTVVDGVGAADFRLNRAVVSLDEIVVTATGLQRKRELANATTTITAAEVTQEVMPVSMASLIQGRAAGVQILNSSGTVGASSKIRIRGSSSISLSNEPLLVVDGIRVENSSASSSFFTGGQTVSRMNDFNPDEIESIEIVKGPSAAALYGTAAANGVIVITTKKGRIGAPLWTAYTEQGVVKEVTEWPDNFRGLDATGSTCRLANVGAGTCVQTELRTANPLASKNTGPFKDGARRQYGLQVQGGTEDAQYFVSGEWEQESGIFGLPQRTTDSILEAGGVIPSYAENPSNLERASFRANINARLGENTSLRISTGYVTSNLNIPQNDNNITGMLPSGLLGGTDSTDNGGWGFFTPEEVFYTEGVQEVDRFTGSSNISWRPTTWLEGHGTLGIDFTQRRDVRFQATGTGVDFSTLREGDRTSNQRSIYQYTADGGLTAQYRLSENVRGKTSWAIQYFRNNVEQIQTFGEILAPGSGSNKSASMQFIDEDFIESITLGTFVEQQVGFDDRLFLTAAVRADDNSAFGRDFNLTYYPKVGASYLAIENGLGIVNDFRVRAAFGASGQQPGSNDATKFFVGTAVVDDDGEQVGVSIQGAGNAALKPERSAEYEFGFDAGFADGRLGLEVTYYNRTTTDALIQRELAPSIGLTATVFDNIGETNNKGWEALFDASVVQSDNFEWDLTLSGSTNSNKIVELGEGVEPIIFNGSQVHQEGLPLGAWKDESFTFNDANGDGIIEVSELTYSDTTEFAGYPRPRYEVSLFNSFELGNNIRVSGLFDYRGGHKKLNFTEEFRCRFNICRWLNDPSSTLAEQAAAQSKKGGTATSAGFLQPGWFVKLREVSITLIAPQKWAEALRLQRMNLVLSGRNLATWTDYLGSDPEVQGNTGNFGGRDFLTQPQVRYFTARLNVTF